MVKQSQGLSGTAFVVRGDRLRPGDPVTFKLNEVGPPPSQKTVLAMTSPVHAVARADGTFSVPVSQLYAGPLPLGLVTVTASEPGGRTASTQFAVVPPQPPSGGAPSPGQ